MREDNTSVAETGAERGPWSPRIAAVAILGFGAVVLYDAVRIVERGGLGPQDSGFFPLVVAVGLLVFGFAFLVRTTVWADRSLHERVTKAQAELHWPLLGLVAIALVAYVFVLDVLGYVVATVLFFVITTRIVGSRRPLRDVAVGVVVSAAVYIGFTEFLGVRLPAGVLEPIL